MKTLSLLLMLFVLACPGISQSPVHGSIELVESIPVETVLDNPEIANTPEVWHGMIASAKTSLDIEEFYISDKPGEPLEAILAEIVKAGERGVSVRILADSRMFKTYPESVTRLGTLKNIESRTIDYGKLAGGIQHAKYFIVDGKEIFLGSQNFDWRSLKHIHELGLRIRSEELVGPYRDIFNLDWTLASDPKAPVPARVYGGPVRVALPSGDTVSFRPTASPRSLLADSTMWDETNIVALIDGARAEVSCQFLTYSPAGRDKSSYAVLEDALKRAASRGVKVSMIVADWGKNHPTVDYLETLATVPNIQVKFSEIPEWSGGYISFARVEHLKYVIADADAFWLGTANAEKSYFYNTRNVGAVIRGSALTAQMRKIFLKSWDGPYTALITPATQYKPRDHGEH